MDNEFKAVLFDLDGVIVDTEPSYSIFWGGIGRKYGIPGDDFAYRIKGTTLTDILTSHFPPALHAEIVDQLNEYERSMQYVIFQGTYRFLSQLRDAGVGCAIVTSSNLEKMRQLFRQQPDLEKCFDCIVTDEDVTRSKPDPEPYLVAAGKFGIDPCQAIVIEDSFNGLLSGRAAGCKVVALATTNPAQSLAGKADLIATSIADLSWPLFD